MDDQTILSLVESLTREVKGISDALSTNCLPPATAALRSWSAE